MADRSIDHQPRPSLLQGAQDMHKPIVTASKRVFQNHRTYTIGYLSEIRGYTGHTVPIYPCLFPYCESAFYNSDALDSHLKLVHLPGVIPGGSATDIDDFFSRATSKGYMNYIDNTMNESDNWPLHHRASVLDAFRIHQNSPWPSITDRSFTCCLSKSVCNQSLVSFAPMEAASTIVSPSALLPTSFVSPPAPPPQPPIAGAPPPLRHICPTCSKTFSRVLDMQRHAKTHDPGAQRFDCPFPGCRYKGTDGFLRTDKLRSHWQNRHLLVEERPARNETRGK